MLHRADRYERCQTGFYERPGGTGEGSPAIAPSIKCCTIWMEVE
jgi:hypothetical protein